MMKRLLCAIFVLATLFGFTQSTTSTGKVSVKITTESGAPLEGATATLIRGKDSVLVKTSISDKTGVAEFESVRDGSYRIKVTMINYAPHTSEEFTVSGRAFEVSTVSLKPKPATDLKDVTVTAKKPFIQRLNDRIVVNVDNSIVNAGSTALDVLERSPGVTLDQNDAISLRGKAGVIIMIDGRRSPLTGADLANYLRGLPSNAIDHIDIITNPSAKYDAAGNSGIIDIHMKKDQRLGANGTLTVGYGQGVYPKANAGGSINYRNKKVNLFANYNYIYRIGLNNLILDRNFYDNGVFTGSDKKDNYSKSPLSAHNTRFGADFFPSKKTIIGFVFSGNFAHFTRENNNKSLVIDARRNPSFTFKTHATNNDNNNNGIANINFKHTFDSTGKELTADVDYGVYASNSLSTTATSYFKLNGSSQQPDYILDGDQDGKLKLRTAKADYVNPLKKGAKFEVGFKTSYVSSDNDAKFFDMSSGIAKNDTTKTNHFFYEEGNNAAYFNFSQQLKKFNYQFGLRGEQTNIKTKQEKGNVNWDSSYFQLFPSAFINYNLTKDQTIGLSVSRRIDRPGYSDLNPFLFLIDVSTYATGRPGLLPQFTWSYELNYTIKNLNFTLGYSRTKQIQNTAIVRFSDVFPNIPQNDPNITVQVPVNLESSDYFGLTVSAPIRVTKWWNMINNANAFYNHFSGNLAGTRLDNGKPAFDVRTNNSFTFKKGWSTELNANYNSGGQYGYMVSKSRWGLAAGVQKVVSKNKATVRFNITDIFWTNLPRATITYNNYIEKWHAYRETRVATLSFTYPFGNNKVAGARKRTTASEEERRRAGG